MEMLDTAKHGDIEGIGESDDQLSNEVPQQQLPKCPCVEMCVLSVAQCSSAL